MDSSSLLTSLSTSLAIFMVLMLLYTRLSTKPGNIRFYYPNRIFKALVPWEGFGSDSRPPRNPFAWIKEALSTTEADMIAVSGVDTAVYFVFLSTVLGILVLSGLALLPVLLPVAAIDSRTTSSVTGVDKYSIGHVKPKSSRLWAFVMAVYWVSLVSYYLLWKACKHVSELRASALLLESQIERRNDIRRKAEKARQFAILVRDIPPLPTGFNNRKEQVDCYFKSIYPDAFYRSIVVTDNTKINKIWAELEGLKRKLCRAEYMYEKSKTYNRPEGNQPTTRTGLFGLIGRKVYTIEYLRETIQNVEAKLKAERKVTLKEKQLSSALVFFTDKLTAATAAQSQHSLMGDEWTVMEAPEPCQIIWSNLSLSFYERKVRQFVVYIIVALTILFYMIPLGFISAMTTLANLEKLVPFLKPIVKIKALRIVLEAYLPQLGLIVFLFVLPKLLMYLSVLEGIPSTSHAVRATSGKYFYFTVFNAFIGVMIGGTVFSLFKTIEEDPHRTVGIVAANLSDNATVFLNYVALKFLVGYGLELSRLVPLILYHLKRKFLCKSEEDIQEAWLPGDLGYETRFPGDMLIATIVLCYSVIAPLILPFGIAYFGLGWLILRNQALKVYIPSFESHGRMWPHIHMRLIGALLLFQVTMLGYSGVKQFYYTPILILLPIITAVFASVCKNKFYRYFKFQALDGAPTWLHFETDMEQVVQHFIPPGLDSQGKQDDDELGYATGTSSRSSI